MDYIPAKHLEIEKVLILAAGLFHWNMNMPVITRGAASRGSAPSKRYSIEL